MPKTFGNLLEAVNGHQHHRDQMLIALRDSQRLGTAVFKQNSIGEIRQRVVVRQMLNLGSAFLNQFFQVVFVKSLLSQQLVMSQCPFHRRLDMTQIQWLGNVIERTSAHGFDSKVDGLLSANHHHDGVGCAFQDPGHQIKSANSSHVDVADYQMESDAVEDGQRLFRRTDGGAIVGRAQQVLEQTSNLLIVVDDQNRLSAVLV